MVGTGLSGARVLVCVPAHDEAAEIGATVAHLARAVSEAAAAGVTGAVAVAAHRCSDQTEELARCALEQVPWPSYVVHDLTSRTVGAVRAGLVSELLRTSLEPPTGRTWLFHTDADSHVPPEWIRTTVQTARATGAVAVTGMVDLRDWRPTSAVRERYRRLIAAGLHVRSGELTHDHVYGANLAVRLDAYLRVGGFRDVNAEDQDLVDRLRAGGAHVAATLEPVVATSARTPGRAMIGLGALLAGLAE